MKFAAIIEYLQDKAKIALVRPVHRQYLADLKAKGQLAASGPFTDDSGALIVYEAASRAEAEALPPGRSLQQERHLHQVSVATVEPGDRQPRVVSELMSFACVARSDVPFTDATLERETQANLQLH